MTQTNKNKKSKLDDIKFQTLGEKERKILLTALHYKLDTLKCQFCHEKTNYKECGIMPSDDKRRIATIICKNILCSAEYINDMEDEL